MMTSLGPFPRVTLACAIAALAVMAPGCAATSPGTGARPAERDALPKQLVERVVVVTLAPASSDSSDRIPVELAGAHGLRHVGAFLLTSIGVNCLVFEVPANRAIDEVMRGLAADPRVESAQPNQVFRNLAAGPPDPYESFEYGARAIRAPQAHRWATGRGVTVAVIDTGIETKHPDPQGAGRTPSSPERPWPPLMSRASSRSCSSGSRSCRPARFASCCSRRHAP